MTWSKHQIAGECHCWETNGLGLGGIPIYGNALNEGVAKTCKKEQFLIWSQLITQWLLTKNEVCIYIYTISSSRKCLNLLRDVMDVNFPVTPVKSPFWDQKCLIPVDEKSRIFFAWGIVFPKHVAQINKINLLVKIRKTTISIVFCKNCKID